MTDPNPGRHLPFEGTRNLRDVGGYPAAGGRRTRWRTLLRSDELTVLPQEAQADLLAMGVRQVIDLRWPDELERSPSVFAGSEAVRYTSLPLLDDDPTPTPPRSTSTATCLTPGPRSSPTWSAPCSSPTGCPRSSAAPPARTEPVS